jgi:hypothetical protein
MTDPAMAAPTLVQQNDGILVSWLVYDSFTVTGYTLHRHDTTDDVEVDFELGVVLSYFDRTLISGHNYCYSIKAVGTVAAPPTIPDVGPYNLPLNAPFSDDPYTGNTTGSPTFSATGLPTGITINPTTGAFSGTPTVSGSYAGDVTATNLAGSVHGAAIFNVAFPEM